MKKLIHNMLRAVLVVLVLGLSSCQEEYEEVGGGSEDQAITANSSTAVLIEKTSSNDGSYDNIVDRASCFSIQFPYTVNVNGVGVTINSKSDLEVIEEIFDELDDDDDILDIVFPIVITLSDYSEVNIENQEELEALARECLEGGDDDDIECIDFVYPITLFTFDIQNQLTGEFQVESDKGMRRFFADLDDNQLISIEFPITLKKYDGTEIVVETNAELAAALETAKNDCDEDDDNDYNDDDFTEEELDALLVACPFQIRQVIRDEIDNTEQYVEYLLTFSEDGTVYMSTFTLDQIMGTWSTSMTDQGVVLELNFENFSDFSGDWYVYELEEGVIKLYKDEGNRVVLKKRCDIDPSDDIDGETFVALLKECEWIIKDVTSQGEELKRLLGYEFQFMADGVVTLGNGVNTMEGTWEMGLNSQYRLSLMISIGEEPGVSFEWPIKEMFEKRLEFKIDETGDEMKLLRVCEDSIDDNDIPEIRNIALGGTWNIALYQEGEVDMTSSYEGMDFNFSTDHQVEVSINADPITNGLWRVLRDSDENLKFYINFDTDDELAELTEDWKIVSVTTTQIKLTDETDDGVVNTLVFEKP
ncbi:MAG: hypothetical protein CMH46_13020 [Muricauda sp.]|nr:MULTISPECIES: hypothetical protein [unclassified Allomuricauda]MAU16447.1 hypothetical protein [Allomuricauda sp.]|tara:strand:- start:3145 stop:4911 length:1767 start_codon:yes stop_codon:yes gene_type:complete